MRIGTQVVLKRVECEACECHHARGYVRIGVNADLTVSGDLANISVVSQECLGAQISYDSMNYRERMFVLRSLRNAELVSQWGALAVGGAA
jgi:hypothetical protein